jgi:hypothetical protein
MVGARMSKNLQKRFKVWAGEQKDRPPFAPAIRRLLKPVEGEGQRLTCQVSPIRILSTRFTHP